MAQHRDVEAFDERAGTYDSGRRGDLHHRISDRAADIVMAAAPTASRVLDIGCGTGFLLRDQRAGIGECARVTQPRGKLVLTDLFSLLLLPTVVTARRGHARTRGRANRLLTAAGFSSLRWHHNTSLILQTVVAEKHPR